MTTRYIHPADLDQALANIRFLESENRRLHKTLRDEFAMAVSMKCPMLTPTDHATWCYRMADAMLEERKS